MREPAPDDPPLRREDRPVALEAVVPARAVLTELARGFLLVHETDPAHAVRFAQTFLRERAGPPPTPRALSPAHLARVRHGVAASLRDPPGP